METLESWLKRKYLQWQQENKLISVKEWAQVLGVGYTTLMTIFSGDRESTSMSTAYQIGERLNDFSILELLGYPVPDAPLVGLAEDERNAVLDWLESVKAELDKLPPDERMSRLTAILSALPDDDTDTF